MLKWLPVCHLFHSQPPRRPTGTSGRQCVIKKCQRAGGEFWMARVDIVSVDQQPSLQAYLYSVHSEEFG